MTPGELRKTCDLLNVERGTGEQTKLARLLGWNPSTVRRKLSGMSLVTQADELAIRAEIIAQTNPVILTTWVLDPPERSTPSGDIISILYLFKFNIICLY
ncbi:family transcriptional regulator : : HTH_8 [Gemmata massiliana]|uniref:Family transcriptional regulator:: HTH_8 n=1 Tax=Gemmata massiliana TaxID=1210884 RepID=A0A6P2CYL4_9BACT|nr:helix-turn-helix domain-containing protein [Gemmata massiliana]VTR94218.1 family transcriptional regulator : : HTH_8 [Gemmata massiliana]